MNVLDGASGFWEVPKTPPPVSHPVPPILLPHWLLRSIFSLSLPSLIISLLDYCLALLLEVTGPPQQHSLASRRMSRLLCMAYKVLNVLATPLL